MGLIFSCFQLEKSAAANKFNMLRNAFFEEAFNATGENGWKLSQGESADQIVTDSVKGKCARLRGNLSKNKNLMQTVKVSGKEGDVFVFGCSVKADAIPGLNLPCSCSGSFYRQNNDRDNCELQSVCDRVAVCQWRNPDQERWFHNK